MIEVKLYKNDMGNYHRYEVEGHAGYAEYGKDIVCAGVSAITQSALLTLERICINARSGYDEKRNYLYVTVPFYQITRKEVQAIFSLLELGIKSIEMAVPKNVKLEIIERNEPFAEYVRNSNKEE
ncbi:ribosomal-processing cysteine protease Prp [Tissierella praeacuta]|uniref:ribosomal-processing cysteine protease Prp n=1 Tax=Tissierella praeacuta TaxID=43131 RepID=UPI002FD98E20